MTKNSYINVRSVINGIMRLAYEREIISSNSGRSYQQDLSKGLLTRTSRKEDATDL